MSELSRSEHGLEGAVKTVTRMTESIKTATAVMIALVFGFVMAGMLAAVATHATSIQDQDLVHLCKALLVPLILIVALLMVRIVLYVRFELGK
jgi:flagellar biosynthesis protein FliQ